MALLNVNTSGLIELKNSWSKVDLGGLHSFYLIGIKDSNISEGAIDAKDVTQLGFEIGIESGITDVYLPIGYLNLNFKEFTSNDSSVNEKTALSRYLNYPDVFYIKPVEICTDKEIFTSGSTNIFVKINTVKLN